MTVGNETQQTLFDALASGEAFGISSAEVEHIETHISCIYLAGEHAYKVKKALDLGFLDFTTLERRREACEEELRLNARLAPEVYLRVAALTGDPARPALDGDGPTLDYAVVMRRFPQSALLSRMLEKDRLEPRHIDELAALLADFHGQVPAAPANSDHGRATAVAHYVNDNLEQLPRLLPGATSELEVLGRWSRHQLERLSTTIDRRRESGCVRECHGDLHLENIIYWRDRVMAFDGIEFNPGLRWIDVANELAFVTMDLDDRGASTFARQLRDAYLERTGDYDALAMLPFYQVYRALVRAKVNALQASQHEGDASAHGNLDQAEAYLHLATSYTESPRARLVLMHGVSGTGKSTLTETLIRQHGYVRLRSDVVRKQLFGLRADERSDAAGMDIYSAQASRRTYECLLQRARTALEAGYSVVVDATFLQRAHRLPFEDLATALDVPFRIVSLHGDRDTLRARVAQRSRAGGDPSEADVDVLEAQLRELEPLADEERRRAVILDIEAIPVDWDQQLTR